MLKAYARISLVIVLAGMLGMPSARAVHLECVGNPPRQTEDPLSPPCVPDFDGDNGGATDRGITADSIEIALYNDVGVDGDMNAPYSPDDDAAGSQAADEQRDLVRTVKAQLRYFQRHFQTYGRTVHVTALASKGGVATPCPQRTADSYLVDKVINPFANLAMLGDGRECFLESMAHDFKRPSVTFGSDLPRETLDDHDPFIWSFMPDQETEAANSAGFICRKLIGRTARFSSGYTNSKRRIGLIAPTRDAQRGPAMWELARLLESEVKRQCGKRFALSKTFVGGGQTDLVPILREFKDFGITTVICYCVPVPTEQTATSAQAMATALDYFPEWYWDHASRMDKAQWEKMSGIPLQHSFGMSYYWRMPGYHNQFPAKAFYEEESEGAPNERFNFEIYHGFLQLFTALQLAGPDLTAASLGSGLRTHARTDLRDPFVPAGGFGAYAPWASGDHAFLDTAMGWWWDPTGNEPGAPLPYRGCLRVEDGGRRHIAGDWPEGDADLFIAAAPCTAANQHAGVP